MDASYLSVEESLVAEGVRLGREREWGKEVGGP